MRLLGIPTVVDRMVQQAINQVLTIIYEPQFSKRSFGFRPRRGCLNALREVQKIVNEGYKYVVDLERFFDTVSHKTHRDTQPHHQGRQGSQSYTQIP